MIKLLLLSLVLVSCHQNIHSPSAHQEVPDDHLLVIIHEPSYGLTQLLLSPSSFYFGHVQLAINCKVKEKNYYHFTGLTGDGSNHHLKMFKQGFGLTSLFSTFKEIQIENKQDVHKSIVDSKAKNRKITGYLFKANHCEETLLKIRKYKSELYKYHFSINHQENTLSCVKYVTTLIKNIIKDTEVINSRQISKKWLANPNEYQSKSVDVHLSTNKTKVKMIDLIFPSGSEKELVYFDIDRLETSLTNNAHLVKKVRIH